jgi:pyruvate kinase
MTRPDRLLSRLLPALRDLRRRALEFERGHAAELALVPERGRPSARNFLHYLSVRQQDIRSLQQDLASMGLTSLGVMESHACASLDAVVAVLEQLAQLPPEEGIPPPPVDFRSGKLLLRDHARELLGPPPPGRSVRVMVTMPGEAAHNPQLIEDLLRAGMDVMRINCAHDDVVAWRAMAAHLREAERRVGRRCRVQADLAGPKLRTGSIAPLGSCARIKPRRDALGGLREPGRAWLVGPAEDGSVPAGAVRVPLPEGVVERLQPGDIFAVVDLRSRKRALRVRERSGDGWLADTDRTIYLGSNAAFSWLRGDAELGAGALGELPPIVEPIRLQRGDRLVLTREDLPGAAARVAPDGALLEPAHVHCTLPAAFERVRDGERVWLDDGKIGGHVARAGSQRIEIEIDHVPPGGARLRAEKGINFPDTDLAVAALTAKDLADLEQVAPFVDMVALSFLRSPDDVLQLEEHLQRLEAGRLGIVLKIENAAAFRNLPRILLASLRSPPVGVMVARGDLAVEVGFERLSEVQEEILWLCEAAHVPVIWATQVLEGLAKGGAPTRAEVSDAVMSSRAECVMLNKGPMIVPTVAFLSDILERMAEHHDKRMNLLRRLSVSELD